MSIGIWMIVIGITIVLLLVILIQLALKTNDKLERTLKVIVREINRRVDAERQAEEAEIARLRFEADRRAEEDSEY